MSSQYAGTPTYPPDFTIPDDNAAPTAANFNPAAKDLGDRTTYLKALVDPAQCVPVVLEFLADGSFTPPADALPWAHSEGCGGGGEGGLGAPSQNASGGLINAGGGGGGGAIKSQGWHSIFPGHSHDVKVGAGGSAGALGFGADGEDTTLKYPTTGATLFTARGAAGGHPGGLACPPTEDDPLFGTVRVYAFSRGGRPVRIAGGIDPPAEATPYASAHLDQTPQAGGLGTCSTWGAPLLSPSDAGYDGVIGQGDRGASGSYSASGIPGGLGGKHGRHARDTNVGGGVSFKRPGGGGGGGGGAGAYGPGGDGGDGSDAAANHSAAPVPSPGKSAAPNTGGGGGGGGAAGSANPPTTTGGARGPGGSGRYRITYWRKMQP